MRSAVVMAAFAAGTLAVPYEKRQVVTDVDVVYMTEVVTVYATDYDYATETATTTTSADDSTAPTSASHYGHNHWSHASSSESSTSEASSTYVAPSTSVTEPVSTYVAPTTTSSTTSTSTTPTSSYVAPTTSSSSSTWVETSAAAASSTAAASTAAASSPVASLYADVVVLHHNIHRVNHSAPNITWSDSVAAVAAEIAATCIYEHNTTAGGGGYGQNIAAGVEANNVSEIITGLMYNGEVGWFADLYGEAQPDMTNFDSWGHFSQIVWAETTTVGCATQYCPNGLGNVGDDVAPYFTVCNYEPPGNYANEYALNIGTPQGMPTVQWNDDVSAFETADEDAADQTLS